MDMLKISAGYNHGGQRYEIWLRGLNTIADFSSLQFVEGQFETGIPEEVKPLALTNEMANSLMNDLWNAGVRPSNDVASVGQLGAQKEHIADLRKITERLLDKVCLS